MGYVSVVGVVESRRKEVEREEKGEGREVELNPSFPSFLVLTSSLPPLRSITDSLFLLSTLRDKFSEYTLSEIKEYNHNSHIYTFKFPDPNAISGGPITHLLMLRAVQDGLIVDDKGKDIAR